MIDLAALTAAVFDRAASEAAGEELRAALGDGAASVITADDLQLRVDDGSLRGAPLPLVALRRKAAPTIDRGIVAPGFTWYSYGDPAVGYATLDDLGPLLWACYRDWLALGVYSVELAAGGHDRDKPTGLLLVRYELEIGSL